MVRWVRPRQYAPSGRNRNWVPRQMANCSVNGIMPSMSIGRLNSCLRAPLLTRLSACVENHYAASVVVAAACVSIIRPACFFCIRIYRSTKRLVLWPHSSEMRCRASRIRSITGLSFMIISFYVSSANGVTSSGVNKPSIMFTHRMWSNLSNLFGCSFTLIVLLWLYYVKSRLNQDSMPA